MQSNIPMTDEEKEKLLKKKTFSLAVKLILYVIAGGAFGAFTRWMQLMLAFDDNGLNNKGAWNVLMPLVVIAAALVYLHFIDDMKKHRYYLPESVPEIFHREGKLFELIPFALGGIMFLGGAIFFITCGDEKDAVLMRCIAASAAISGIVYPIIMKKYMDEDRKPIQMSLMAFIPMLTFTLWLVMTYKINAINSVVWAYGVEILAVCAALMGFFRMGGFAFDRPDGWRAIYGCMFGGFMCITSIADSRGIGQQAILIAAEGMLIFDLWIMINNLRQGAAPKKVRVDDGFEHIQYRP